MEEGQKKLTFSDHTIIEISKVDFPQLFSGQSQHTSRISLKNISELKSSFLEQSSSAMHANTVHSPKEVPRNEFNRKLRKRCIVCSHKGKRTESNYYCGLCPNNPGLCIFKCFAKFHGYSESN